MFESKKFFENQKRLREDQLQIPCWYYPVEFIHYDPIIRMNKIYHERLTPWNGVLMSNIKFDQKGKDSIFMFKNSVMNLPNSHYASPEEKGDRLIVFKSIQQDVPLYEEATNFCYLAMVGIYKGATKEEKKALAEKFHSKNIEVTISSMDQLEFMQQEYVVVIGSSNPWNQ